jgi:LCP family protein required for cell wall assembly
LKKQEQKNKTVFHAVAALLAVLAVVLVLYGGGRWLEKRAEKPETRTQLPQADQETVEVDGVTYRKKSRLTTILVMGVDHETQETYDYRKAGQADFLRLIVLDNKNKTVQQLQIDRDTITPVTMLGVLGDRYEPVTQQICLGYAFGDGRQSSCEVTVEAVENLLGGQKIDQYLSMGLDGISTLNDLAGGVTVTLEDDFSAIDPAMTKGTTLTLWGDQAEVYVRTRRSIGVGTNEARMARQEQYIRQITSQLDAKVQQDQNFVLTAYDALEPYLYTNIPRGQLANEAWAAKDYERMDTIKPDGTYQVGEDGFMEFYPDADALQQAVLQLFYEKVE